MTRFFLKILFRFGWLRFFNLTAEIRRNGHKIKVPVIKSLGRENLDLSELWMCGVLERVLPYKSGCFIDVGVNLGQTLIKLKLVDESRFYVGFDPNPNCIYYTKELIRENGFQNAVLIPVGIAADSRLLMLNFYTAGEGDSSASIVEGFRPTVPVSRREFVACFNYDMIEHSITEQNVSVVKVDVEGAELEVLKGLRKLLEMKRPFILIEILPVYNVGFAGRWDRLIELEGIIKQLDYVILRIIKFNGEFERFESLETIGVSDKIEDADYLLCPSEEISKITSPRIQKDPA
jgi:FkbM family methyltransferase